MRLTSLHSVSHLWQSLFGAFLLVFSCIGLADDATCGGYSTLLYSSDRMTLTICHGPYTKIDRAQLSQWQGCDDAVIYLRDKEHGTTLQFADCLSEAGKQFRVQGDSFMLRHFYATYSSSFDFKPLLVETQNFTTRTKTYQLETQFPICTKTDIDEATNQIDETTARPFDGTTYFSSVYGGFYKLRDCSQSDPKLALSILNKYKRSGLFDGEVAETLSSVLSEVELIHAATMR